MKSTTFLCAAAALSILTILVGCDTTKAPLGVKRDPDSSPNNPQIVGLDGLGKHLRYDNAIVRTAPNQALSVTVPVRVAADKQVRAQYRFTFLAPDGKPVSPEMDWQYKVLPARGWVYLLGVALDPEATDWRLDIRPAR